jgi:SAM-dependent methyltransferase
MKVLPLLPIWTISFERTTEGELPMNISLSALDELASRTTDDAWLRMLVQAADSPTIEGVRFPASPAPDWQAAFVGSSGVSALHEAFQFYRLITGQARELGQPLNRASRVLDFGCGWGRYIRFFMKCVASNNLFGVDVDPDMIGFCKISGLPAQFSTVPPFGPTGFEAKSFDLIYAYSVFSHLAEPAHLAWLQEFCRILRPGALLVITTQARHFMDHVQLVKEKAPEARSDWERSLCMGFPDPAAVLAAYDRGDFVFADTGGGDHRPPSFYGEALIPQNYIEHRWPRGLKLLEFIDDGSRFPQAVAILRAV